MLRCALLLLALLPRDVREPDGFEPEVWGLARDVTDLDRAEAVYAALGFERERDAPGEGTRVLTSGDLRLVLRRGEVDARRAARGPGLYLHASDLVADAERARTAGAELLDEGPRAVPVGRCIGLLDPDGHPLALLELDRREAPARAAVLDLAWDATEAAQVEDEAARLGLRVQRRDLGPKVLPFERRGAAALLVHLRDALDLDARPAAAVLLRVDALEPAAAALRERGLEVDGREATTAVGRTLGLRGPGGLPLRLVERGPAREAFERFLALTGTWRGRSTRGWTDTVEIELMAAGTAVASTARFEGALPMLTVWHVDGDRLLLTHYCEARNHPRLEATRFAPDEVEFTFLDGTNLPSRERGHMDRAVFRFADGTFSSRWTWYQDGRESWMEEIAYERLP